MTMPYWAERLRVRLIHELGGYTAEDVAKEIYEATRATPPCKSETFMVEEYQAVIRLGGNAYAPADAKQIDRAKAVEKVCQAVIDKKVKTPDDVAVVVRCKGCKHYDMGVCLKIYSDGNVHSAAWQSRRPDDFCSYGERKDCGDADR